MRAKKRALITADDVGGEIAADLVFQYALDDKSKQKDWKKICSKAGISERVTAAEAYYNQLLSATRPSRRWTTEEIHIIDLAIRDGTTKCLDKQLPGRSLKSIRSKILERKKKRMTETSPENMDHLKEDWDKLFECIGCEMDQIQERNLF